MTRRAHSKVLLLGTGHQCLTPLFSLGSALQHLHACSGALWQGCVPFMSLVGSAFMMGFSIQVETPLRSISISGNGKRVVAANNKGIAANAVARRRKSSPRAGAPGQCFVWRLGGDDTSVFDAYTKVFGGVAVCWVGPHARCQRSWTRTAPTSPACASAPTASTWPLPGGAGSRRCCCCSHACSADHTVKVFDMKVFRHVISLKVAAFMVST